ncbi:glycosyltransferase family 2 protein [Dyadobacter luticola]|uniref:Glycosyltransferase n=1 Tax=Dyadobacter luticola TaxID=1979387 RepID=A0A5R9KPK6_9BACT|nr:cellulose synthase catalytic subunit [Dyadobacter luticola]TLU98215.1 glycosyltransferase [Dyadobacter luticola]
MKEVITVKSPTRLELLTLRLMILLGLAAMWFFLKTMFSPEIRGSGPLYGLLMITFVFTCLKILHEWLHYFYITVPVTPPATRTYTVDIFTTFVAGEPYGMIEETLTALQAVTYPHQTYLCDEANDPRLKAFCEKLGVHHVTRTVKKDAKAGNINNALAQSSGELCVVLDPDHVPFPEFLNPIVSHFDNPEIGFVQIVQAYKNHRESLIAKGAAQQTYQFYGPMMMTMNKYGTVQAIGANCTFRRSALESIGGHAAGLAEDMHTSMQLHAKGWKSVYVPSVLARGLVPSTLSAYYQQQLKWSRGVFDLLVIAYPKLFSQFTWKQKLHYAAIPLHYASGLIFLANFLIPLIALFFNKSPVYIGLENFGLTVFPLLVAIILIRHFVQWWVMEDDERGFHMVGGLLTIGTWWVFLTGLIYTILRKKVPYVPTPKEGHEDGNWLLNVPNIIILLVSLAAIVYGLSNDWNPYNLAMAGFAWMNCLIMIFVIGASREQHFRRWRSGYAWLNKLSFILGKAKGSFWLLRRRIYNGIRNAALVITTIFVAALVYFKTGGLEDFQSKPARTIKRNSQIGKFSPTGHVRSKNADSTFAETFAQNTKPQRVAFAGTQGVNYSKGQDWSKKLHVFTKKELENDFAEMRRIHFNAIKRYGPNMYDRNVLREARQQGFQVHYGFWIPENIDFKKDKKQLDELQDEISQTVRELKDHAEIVSWNIGNDVLQKMEGLYNPADLQQQEQAALIWLQQIVIEIKKIDRRRPVTMDVEVSDELNFVTGKILHAIPEIDAFGLIIDDKMPLKKQLDALPAPYFISYVSPKNQRYLPGKKAAFVSNWQDEEWADKVRFDGMKDFTGRYKADTLAAPVKILKPAAGTFPGVVLAYHVIVRENKKWTLPKPGAGNLHYEWKLVKTDDLDNPTAVSDVGAGPRLMLQIPPNPSEYRLYLYVVEGNVVKSIVSSTLNTPLQVTAK